MNVEQLVASIMPVIMDKAVLGKRGNEREEAIKEICRQVAKDAYQAGWSHTWSEEEYIKSIGI